MTQKSLKHNDPCKWMEVCELHLTMHGAEFIKKKVTCTSEAMFETNETVNAHNST
jgi:hypothetical protein